MITPTSLQVGQRVYSEWSDKRHPGTIVEVEELDDEMIQFLEEYPDEEQSVTVAYDYGETVIHGASRCRPLEIVR